MTDFLTHKFLMDLAVVIMVMNNYDPNQFVDQKKLLKKGLGLIELISSRAKVLTKIIIKNVIKTKSLKTHKYTKNCITHKLI